MICTQVYLPEQEHTESSGLVFDPTGNRPLLNSRTEPKFSRLLQGLWWLISSLHRIPISSNCAWVADRLNLEGLECNTVCCQTQMTH